MENKFLIFLFIIIFLGGLIIGVLLDSDINSNSIKERCKQLNKMEYMNDEWKFKKEFSDLNYIIYGIKNE
jgi:hypothetical protein